MTAYSSIEGPRIWSGRPGSLARALLACTLLLLALAATATAETTTHAFDAKLSLAGDCNTFPGLDEVPDPGLCPMPPGVPGVDHPSAALAEPGGVTTDEYGDLYVPSRQGVVDIFDQSGRFLTEIKQKNAVGVAVDSQGHLYVYTGQPTTSVVRFDPTVYNPAGGEIKYGNPAVLVLPEKGGLFQENSVTVDHDGHLYVTLSTEGVKEFGNAAEENKFIETIGQAVLHHPVWTAIDRSAELLYVSDTEGSDFLDPSVIRVFDLNRPGHPLKNTIDGSTTPAGEFPVPSGDISVAVQESNHHVFVDERRAPTAQKPVYEFTESGEYVGKVEHDFAYQHPSGIRIDNGSHSPNSGYLFVPSGASHHDHVYAFAPLQIAPPVVKTEPPSGLSATEAVLRATVNPEGAATEYAFEYTTQQRFEEEGFAGATVAGGGQLPVGKEPVAVSAAVSALSPSSAYRFRVVATNSCPAGCGGGEDEASFSTYPQAPSLPPCSNEALRNGPASALPDCRAYELVSPADTNGRPPVTVGNSIGAAVTFGGPAASPSGDAVSFLTIGGAIPGLGGSGSAQGDGYLDRRTSLGWQTESAGPTGEQSTAPFPGALSADLGYSDWTAESAGDLATPPGSTYVRYPDGSFHVLGRGSLGVDPFAGPLLITPGGAHIFFSWSKIPGRPPIQLEPNAPPTGTQAIYDRTSDEVTHVVSLLPGDLTPAAGEHATFQGASPDGRGVVFTIGGVLYERLDEAQTFEVASGATFAGISESGSRVFYLKGGNLFAFEVGTGSSELSSTGDVTPVNISADGSRAYFVSPSVLAPGETNSQGDEAQPGEENLYLSDGSATRYVATVTEADVIGETTPSGQHREGLGLWVEALKLGGTFAIDPSRATADGSVFTFSSRADLTSYRANGKAEVYRYDAGSEELSCLSCLPTSQPPSGNAALESVSFPSESVEPSPTAPSALIPNLSPDGKRVFFESSDALVPADTNGVQDVYEWEAQGKGSCEAVGGCVSLISSGRSARPTYLYGASTSGDDVFFSTSDLVAGADHDETPSIYDARVDGGFPSSSAREECLGEACQPAAVALNDLTPASLAFSGSGNLVPQLPVKTKAKAKTTNTQKLAKALKACQKKRKSQRRRCVDQARNRYGRPAGRSSGARHVSADRRAAR